jgi:hypothetical protein
MANITINDLYTRFRAAGVYTVYRDETVAPAINAGDVIRLVYGFSAQGPFNRLVFIARNDFETASRIFGPIDRKLERNNSYFHRSLAICLEEGPVLALNLHKLYDQESGGVYPADLTPYRSFSVALGDINGANQNKLHSSYYNKQRFWNPDREYLLATRDNIHSDYIFNLVNLSKTPCTFIVKKSQITGFDVTAKEWYGNSNIPDFIRPDDYISDYFIDVYVIDGNFGPDRYTQLSSDPVFGAYFNQRGLLVNQLDSFLALPEVNVRNIYTGCMVPEFRDRQNTPYYIEDVINSRFNQDGIYCAIDVDQLDEFEFETNTKDIDLVGHSLIGNEISEIDVLSYKKRIAQDLLYDEKATNSAFKVTTTSGYTVLSQPGKLTVTITSNNADFDDVVDNLELGSLVIGTTTAAGTAAGVTISAPVLRVIRVVKSDSTVTFDLGSDFKDNETTSSGSFVDIDTTGNEFSVEHEINRFFRDGTDTFYLADIGSQVYADWQAGILTDGDKISDGTDDYFLQLEEIKSDGGLDSVDDYRDLLKISLFSDEELTTAISAGAAPDFGETFDSFGFGITTATKFNIISSIGDLNQRIDATRISDNVVRVDLAADISFDNFLVGFDDNGEEILTRITNITNVDTNGDDIVDKLEVTTANRIKIYSTNDGSTSQIERYKDFTTVCDIFDTTYQPGLQMKKHHMPDGTNARMKDIVSVMTEGTIKDALVDPDMVNFRYIVDTFSGGLEPNTKSGIASLVRDRQVALALLNTPSVKEFEDSPNPRFTDTPTNVNPVPELNIKYIKDGGNREENPDFLYTMPTESQGSSWCGFYFPDVTILDGDIPRHMPPAALVSNNFIRKFRNGEPFKAVANRRRGTLSSTSYAVSGLTYLLTPEDRGNLESKGINPLKQNRDGSVVIFGNQTAFQSFRSVLNNLHVRDLLITLQIEIENLLSNYVFEFNNDAIRLEIDSLIRNYLSNVQNSFNAINFYDVVIDRSNNRPEIIRENVAILDVIIEPVDVATRYINRITLSKEGAPAVGGFTAI